MALDWSTMMKRRYFCMLRNMCSKPQFYHHATALKFSTIKTICKPQKHLKSMFTSYSENTARMNRFLRERRKENDT